MNFKKSNIFFILLALSLLVLIYPIEKVDATDSIQLKVESTTTTLKLSWDSIGDSYKIQDDNNDSSESRELYSGPDTTVTIQNLLPDTPYKYILKAYKNNEVIKEEYISTKTKKLVPKTNRSITSIAPNLDCTSVLSLEGITLQWSSIPDVSEYQIFRNGVLIGSTQTNVYIDHTFESNKIISYEIKFDLLMNSSEQNEFDQYLSTNNIQLSPEDYNNSLHKGYSIIKIVDTNKLNTTKQTRASIVSYGFTYYTFIKPKHVSDPWYNFVNWGQGIKYFSGDDRNFGFGQSTYRTKMWTYSSFISGSSTIQFDKARNSTTGLDSNYNPVLTKYADMTNLYALSISKSSTKTITDYFHKVGNPFAVPGAEIDYTMRITTYSNGLFNINGVHDRAPHHELYIQLNNSGINTPLFQHVNEGFNYLAEPSTSARTFSISN
jgi:hypothetical protein